MGATTSSAGFQPNYKDYCLSSPLSNVEPRYDVIVIGSGYGGAIAASRAARAGKRVCVFEKGREWRPGDFPETESSAAKEIQMTIHKDKTIGNSTNLFDVIVSPDVTVLQGCGLGGTSLINANVALEVEPRIFDDQVWPQALRDDLDTMNSLDKQRVLEMLQPVEYPSHFPELAKMANMSRAAVHIADIENLDVTSVFKRTPLYVNFTNTEKNRAGIPQPACISCGNCCSGCNTGAKNTLNLNYLPDAKAHGAHIFTQVEVKSVVRDSISDCWKVYYIHHIRKQQSFVVKEQIVRANVVILGAGALGSTNILLKSQSLGLPISSNIGKHFTTNGDTVGFSYNGASVVRPVGKDLGKTRKKGPFKVPGPTVTSIIDMRDRQGKGVGQSYVLQDCTAPSSVELPFNFLIRWLESGFSGNVTTPGEDDWKELRRHISGRSIKNTLAMWSMSNDAAGGEIRLDKKTGRVLVHYPDIDKNASLAYTKTAMERTTKALKGSFISNPYWGKLVAKLGNTKVITVHPLGGCGMGESGVDGVVNHAGQVFVGSTGELHPGLFVLDGSIMPRSLGINPSLTISMAAERGMRLMAEQYNWEIDFKSSKVIDLELTRARPGVRFTERLHGQMTINDKTCPCELILTIESTYIEHMMQISESHEAKVYGTVACKELSSCPLTVSHGHMTLFSKCVDKVQTREMMYVMNVSSTEGAVYHVRGAKVIHKDSALEIGKADTTSLDVTVYEGLSEEGPKIGNAKLNIRGGDIIKKLSTIEVTNASGKMERLKWKTKFCTFFLGQMWQVYGVFTSGSTPFDPTAPPRERRRLQLNGAEAQIYPLETEDGLELFLTRYHGGSKGPVMLVHGMGVSSKIFTLDTVKTNLVEFLVANGYDVWLLEWRASILLPSAEEKTTIDICGEYDVPAAVKKILAITGHKDLQILSHCAGSAVTCASILSGKLHGKVRCLLISQSGFCTVPTTINWWKSHMRMPQLLYGIGVEGITAYTDSEQNWMSKILNQFFEGTADLTTAFAEHCDNHVCHRITFLYGLLYEHCNFNNATHETLHEQFGYGDAKLLKHFAKCFEKEHLVDHEGNDKYLPDFKLGLKSKAYTKKITFLDIPIQFCSGEKNSAFDQTSTLNAYNRCKEAHPEQHYERFVVPEYGHIDCIMGKNAAKDVFPMFLTFLEKYAEAK